MEKARPLALLPLNMADEFMCPCIVRSFRFVMDEEVSERESSSPARGRDGAMQVARQYASRIGYWVVEDKF